MVEGLIEGKGGGRTGIGGALLVDDARPRLVGEHHRDVPGAIRACNPREVHAHPIKHDRLPNSPHTAWGLALPGVFQETAHCNKERESCRGRLSTGKKGEKDKN